MPLMESGGRKQTAPAFYVNQNNEQTVRINEYNKSANLYGSAKAGVGFNHGFKSSGAQRNTDNNFNKKQSYATQNYFPPTTGGRFDIEPHHDDKLSTFLEVHERKKLRLF